VPVLIHWMDCTPTFTATHKDMPTSSKRQRCVVGQLLTPLVLLACSTSPLADSSEIIDNDRQNESESPINRMEQYYFTQEINFFARQAMILGNHPDADTKTTSSDSDVGQKEVNRLRFIEKSLKIELDYIRRLRALMDNPDGVLANKNITHATVAGVGSRRNFLKRESRDGKEIFRNASEAVLNTISEATWSTWAYLPVKLPQNVEYDNDLKHDADWFEENGFVGAYTENECHDHAYDQNKTLYTPEMWRILREAFRESTLYPFPLPEQDEIPDKVYYVDHSTDGKGRGNFASKNITKGTLTQSGHPYTVFFLDAASWYRYLALLPRMMVCDVMEWSWQQDLTDTGHVVMCLNLDEAVFFNDGGHDSSTNMEMTEKSSLDFYATEDISVGQELLYDYDHYVFDTTEMNL